MARWIQSRRRPLAVHGDRRKDSVRGEDEQAAEAAVRLGDLREALAGVGTTLDADAICTELTRAAVRLAGGTAAVLRRTGDGFSGYDAIHGNPELLPDARWARAAAREVGVPAVDAAPEPWLEYAGGTRPGAALCLLLTSGEEWYGVLVWARPGAALRRAEAELLAMLAERAAVHIRHAGAYEQVSRTAGDLQRALLAEPGRPHPNLDVAIRYLPAGRRTLVGGDWCETVRLHFGRTLLVVGDVMGHGLESAVDMSAYRSSLRYIASADLPPHRVLRQMDDIASGEEERRPATCLLARVDPGRGQITLASAGHLPPVLIGRQGEAVLLPAPVGPPLGTGLGGYESANHGLEPGETLVLFTDGLVERRGEDIDHSLARLAALRFPADGGVGEVLDTVLARLDAEHAEDDVAILAARPHLRPAPADADAQGPGGG
ncbi:PP2C family protein-serine/threonine phosphatase [Streptomyces actinomycinicus]|uniref:PP2C family protein-serine/threonine phosphatase n=1 Tax=Streptomyces actinomycinicus TaxID=1695166 RepID=UPI003557C780